MFLIEFSASIFFLLLYEILPYLFSFSFDYILLSIPRPFPFYFFVPSLITISYFVRHFIVLCPNYILFTYHFSVLCIPFSLYFSLACLFYSSLLFLTTISYVTYHFPALSLIFFSISSNSTSLIFLFFSFLLLLYTPFPSPFLLMSLPSPFLLLSSFPYKYRVTSFSCCHNCLLFTLPFLLLSHFTYHLFAFSIPPFFSL